MAKKAEIIYFQRALKPHLLSGTFLNALTSSIIKYNPLQNLAEDSTLIAYSLFGGVEGGGLLWTGRQEVRQREFFSNLTPFSFSVIHPSPSPVSTT